MCDLWLGIATGNGTRAINAAKKLQVPEEFTWLLPLALARKTADGEPVDRQVLEKKWADNKAKGGVGRPGIGEASLIGQNLSKEMIIVLRANALVRNVIKALGNSNERETTALEIKRQWAHIRYAVLGTLVPNSLGARTVSTTPTLTKIRWKLSTFVVGAKVSKRAFTRAIGRVSRNSAD